MASLNLEAELQKLRLQRAELDQRIAVLLGKDRGDELRAATHIKGGEMVQQITTDEPRAFSSIEEALIAFRNGEYLVVVDDEDRENEGDLIIAAEKMTKEQMSFMIRHTSGVVCVAITEDRKQQLALPVMVADNTERHRTCFTVSIDLKNGTSTGISATDRTATIKALADPTVVSPQAFARPGHIFPLVARNGGVLERNGHTEASVDLCKLAGLQPAGCLCEIVKDDGDMARRDYLLLFAKIHKLHVITIADLIEYVKLGNRSPGAEK